MIDTKQPLPFRYVAITGNTEKLYKELSQCNYNAQYPSAIDHESQEIYTLVDTQWKRFWLVDERTLMFSRDLNNLIGESDIVVLDSTDILKTRYTQHIENKILLAYTKFAITQLK